MVTVEDYNQEGFGGGPQEVQELSKAMTAGQITGRDAADQALTYEPLKAESLEKSLKLLEFRTQDIKLWNAVPKISAYNTVEEFFQLQSYGAERGGFYREGELSDVEDSTYVRRAEHVKYMQVTGEVTMQAQMMKSYVDAMRKETENKMQWVLRLADRSLTRADSDIIPEEFNSYYKQHASIGSGAGFLYSNFEAYYNQDTVIDMRGRALTQSQIEDGALIGDLHYSTPDTIFAPTTVISNLSKDYYDRQRIILGGGSEKFAGNGVPKMIPTTMGDISLNSDKFMQQGAPRTTASPADGTKAPGAPTADGATPIALAADATAKFTSGEAGNVYYAVAAVNRYGESQLTVLGAAVALAVGYAVNLKFTAGSGANAPTGYVIYRTKVTAAGSAAGLSFYPIFKVSTADQSTGYNGGGTGIVRDRGYFMPDTEQAFITQMNDEVMSFKQLAPMSKLDLAVVAMARRFIVFLFGTPQLYAPKKMIRYINVGKQLA